VEKSENLFITFHFFQPNSKSEEQISQTNTQQSKQKKKKEEKKA